MATQRKVETVETLKRMFNDYSVIGVLNMHKMPARQLFEIRNALKGQAVIRMAKTTLVRRALQGCNKPNIAGIEKHVSGEMALLFSNTNPFKLYMFLDKNKSPAAAKPGDVTPKDIIIPAGPTQFAPGPVIGEFQRAKVQTTVEGGKIVVRKDTTVARAGDKLSKEMCEFISKFSIEPMEIGLDFVAAWDNGIVFAKDVLGVSQQRYVENIAAAYSSALNLAVASGYPTKDSVQVMIRKAYNNARAVALRANVYEPEVMPELIRRAAAAARAIDKKVGG